MMLRARAFIDGGYLRRIAVEANVPWPNPWQLAWLIARNGQVSSWGSPNTNRATSDAPRLTRVVYYDGRPDSESDTNENFARYWRAIELLPDCHLGFGALRGGGTSGRPLRQKGVDTLIAVDMLAGAFDRVLEVVILIAGDADFVPPLIEVRRRGAMTVVAGERRSVSSELQRSADRFVEIGPEPAGWLHPLELPDK